MRQRTGAPPSPDANPYQRIVQKNPFRLLPPVERAIEVLLPPTNVTLQGITTAPGRPRALLKITSPGLAPEISVILVEGERTSGVEVTRIDPANRTVSVLNNSTPQTLFLEAQSVASRRSSR